EFAVNVPVALAGLRAETYRHYAWPGAFSGLFEKNGAKVAIAAALAVAAFLTGFIAFVEPQVLYAGHTGPGAFYAVMPHNAMVVIFGAVFVFAIAAMAQSLRAFWRDTGGAVTGGSLWRAMIDAGTLRNLEGGGAGCMNDDERPTDNRRHYHHFTFYGFLLCLASTSLATLFHYALGWQAPYGWFNPVVVLGTLGGIGLVIGPAGLLAARRRRDPAIAEDEQSAMGIAFLWMLLLTGLTGLVLLVFRTTPAMGILLAVHLGFVLGLFVSMPYGKFVHGLYRFAALVNYARERCVMNGLKVKSS
ncbi:MAG TPA: tricarballylate utilization 4Fe-4S protein TcuB, partial [Afifellaceae bacterium]|nr:tricarballylate utilization 4Fe-4S protein TcuB [Afifellaceae bacterium]